MGRVFLRYATEKDAVFLFDLANDSECRRNSLNSDKIAFKSHVQWLKNLLCSDTQKLYILVDEDEAVGQGRLELTEEGCRISYSIVPERRGYGYGGILLKLLNNAILRDFPSCIYSYGEVLQHNVASQKIFEELGYEARKVKNVFCYRKLVEYYEVAETDAKNREGGGILLLSNNRNAFALYDWLKSREEKVYFYSGMLEKDQIIYLDPVLVVSYNYSFLIPVDIIFLAEDKMINMHISYLPWNKGSDPNFWSFIDNTPKGVSIHQLSAGLDQGAILVQKELFFDEATETFRSTYEKLNREIVSLFQDNFERIKNHELLPSVQFGRGSYHKRSDFIRLMGNKVMNWEETIKDFKKKNNF